MKHIRKFNESNQDKLSKFHKEYEELCKDEDLGNHELWTEIGQLTLKYDLTKDDVLFVLNNFNCKFDVNGFLKQTWSDWDDNLDEDNLWDELLNRISGYSFPKDYHKVINILKSKYDISRK
jgi:acid phosphatase class B